MRWFFAGHVSHLRADRVNSLNRPVRLSDARPVGRKCKRMPEGPGIPRSRRSFLAGALASGAAAAPLLAGAENAAASTAQAFAPATGRPSSAPVPWSRDEKRDEARWRT